MPYSELSGSAEYMCRDGLPTTFKISSSSAIQSRYCVPHALLDGLQAAAAAGNTSAAAQKKPPPGFGRPRAPPSGTDAQTAALPELPRGISNPTGHNHCTINATLQGLYHCLPFREAIMAPMGAMSLDRAAIQDYVCAHFLAA